MLPEDQKVLTFTVEDNVEFSQYQLFRDPYSKIEVIGRKFVLDLSRAAYMDSRALGIILLLKRYITIWFCCFAVKLPK
jgi:anti-anti-sigma regulatory factor